MEYFIPAGIVIIVIFAALALWRSLGLKKGGDAAVADSIMMLKRETEFLRQEITGSVTNHLSIVNQRLDNVTAQVSAELKNVATQLLSSTGQINQRMDNAARVVGEVKQGLGELGEATKQVLQVGKDMASLQEILRAPKLRGEIGEFFLGDLLSQILPSEYYELQYTFKNGTRVDAAIKLNQGIVPVDSKFPLENFKLYIESAVEQDKKAAKRKFIKNVKDRIDEIASSYILPEEGTFNFALMYIPAENVYYEMIIKDDNVEGVGIAAYAFSKRVIPVSPNSFYAYLQTILLGLRGLEISSRAQDILSRLEGLNNDFDRLTGDFNTMGTHIANARNKYEETGKKLERFGEKLTSLGGLSEKPITEGTPAEKGALL